MTALKQDKRPERRCILTREVLPKEKLIRCVEAPDGTIVPDVASKLPGRGLYVTASRELVETALSKGQLHTAISRALKKKVPASKVGSDLADTIERLLRRRVLDRLGLELRAGNLMTGFDKIKAGRTKKGAGEPVLMLHASDGGEDGKKKMRAVVGPDIRTSDVLTRDELSEALGKDNVVHAIIGKSGGADILLADLDRLEGMCGVAAKSD